MKNHIVNHFTENFVETFALDTRMHRIVKRGHIVTQRQTFGFINNGKRLIADHLIVVTCVLQVN